MNNFQKIIDIIIYKNYNKLPKNYYWEIEDWKMLLWEEALSFFSKNEKVDDALMYHYLNQFLLNRIQDLFTKKRNINNVFCTDPFKFRNLYVFTENHTFISILTYRINKIVNNDEISNQIVSIFLKNYFFPIYKIKKIIKEKYKFSNTEINKIINEIKKLLNQKEEEK